MTLRDGMQTTITINSKYAKLTSQTFSRKLFGLGNLFIIQLKFFLPFNLWLRVKSSRLSIWNEWVYKLQVMNSRIGLFTNKKILWEESFTWCSSLLGFNKFLQHIQTAKLTKFFYANVIFQNYLYLLSHV